MNKRFKGVLTGAAGALVALAGSAHAAVPAGVSTALDDLGTDGSSMATIVLTAIVIVFAIKFLRKGL